MIVSKRGLPLIISEQVTNVTLTGELYCKWYELYLVSHDGVVQRVPFSNLEIVADLPYRDHAPNPDAIEAYAALIGAHVDPVFLYVAIGMWSESLL